MEARASAKYVRISPRKARRVVDLIRGTGVLEARRRLQFSPLGATQTVAKVLNSAVANAEQTPGIIPENLVVKAGWVDEGPTLKRYRPRAYGRATQIRKHLERITGKRVDVKVEDMNQAASDTRPETDATLLAQGVAEQLAGRVSFRRAMRRAVQTAMRAG